LLQGLTTPPPSTNAANILGSVLVENNAGIVHEIAKIEAMVPGSAIEEDPRIISGAARA
jgi:hypothetical protein